MNVLLARQDSAGDVLLMGPAVRAVAARAERVTFLAGPRGAEAASLLPGVDDVVVRHAAWIDAEPEPVSPGDTLAFVDDLAARRFDQAVIFTSFHQSPLPLALLLRLAGVASVAAISDDYPGSLLDVRHRIRGEMHEVERALSLVHELGYELPPGDDGRLAVDRDGVSPADGFAPYVVVHPGASVPARAWAPERHRALVEALVAEGRSVVVTGGPDERELTRFVAGEERDGVLDLGGKTDLGTLAEVIADAEAIVVGNTGPAHLAAAVGTPVVSLYAPTVPAVRWRPWAVPYVLLGDQEAACAGSRARVCPVHGHPCLSSVSVEDVLEALAALAGRTAPDLVEAAP